MQKINNIKIILVTILFLAAFLRLFSLSEMPPSLNWDEVSHGYNAYSILKTGRDEWGKIFPIANFRAYGDYPLPLNLYLTIPFLNFLGLSEFSIRLPHALLGVLTVLSIFYLSRAVFKKDSLALLASFLAAIGPWYVFPSRFVVQSNLSVLFLTAGMALFFNRKKKKYFLPLSFLFLGLTLFSYHSTRIFTPLLVILIFIFYQKEIVSLFKKKRKMSLLTLGIITIFFLPLPFILANDGARARSSEVFLIDEGVVGEIIEKRQASALPASVSRFFYNRPVYFVKAFFTNYVKYFSPKFLFFSGGTQYQFSIPQKGLSYLINLPFFYIGLLFLIKKSFKGERDYKLLLGWLLLAPIPASITKETYAVIRSTTILPLPEILIALGVGQVLKGIKLRFNSKNLVNAFLFLYLLVVLFESSVYFKNYFVEYKTKYSWVWQYGYKEVVDYVGENYDEYEKIVVTKKYGEPHEFFLFYMSWDPAEYRNDPNLNRFFQTNWYWVDSFDKFFFINDWQINEEGTDNFVFVQESGEEVDCGTDKCLLVTSPGNVPSGWGKIKEIGFLDGGPAFEIYKN